MLMRGFQNISYVDFSQTHKSLSFFAYEFIRKLFLTIISLNQIVNLRSENEDQFEL